MENGKRRSMGDKVSLEMTPMIDVVFQLLIFFIVTLKQDDILSQLEALRPADSCNESVRARDPNTIQVSRQGYIFNGAPATETTLNNYLNRLARQSPDTAVILKCMPDSPHGMLVRALDICNNAGLRKLSVFSF